MRFFDHNATTPLRPEAKTAWLEAGEFHWLNPSSPYRAGAVVHAQLEGARTRLAELLNVDAGRIVFNSGATEGNNAVFATWARNFPPATRIAVGATEHPSVVEAAKYYFNDDIDWLKPAGDGVVCPEGVNLTDVSGVSLMAANNETGILNPWQDWVQVCHERGILMHCDASQWIGKMPLTGLGDCDYVTACAHKFGGPKGVGFILMPESAGCGLLGGVQEGGRRAGTEDVPGILAMVAALEAVESGRGELRDKFISDLREAFADVEIVGAESPALWNTVSIIMPKFKSVRWIRALEKRDFLVSAGSACSTGKGGPSHVLAAMGLDAEKASRVLRISSGWQTSGDDWAALRSALLECYGELLDDAAGSNSQVISI